MAATTTPSPVRPLRGRTVVTTRQDVGRLDRRLAVLGADVVHVPLIAVVDAVDGGAALRASLDGLASSDWVVVTSPNGAERVAPSLARRRISVGVVGTRTGAVIADLTGRPPDCVPDRQTAADLAAAMPVPAPGTRLLLAQADRADPAHAAAFADRGYDVTSVVAYRTELRRPTWRERRAAVGADAVAFASGSAAIAWTEAIGTATPPVTVAIGPSTAAVARELGLQITHQATDHSIEGLAAAIVGAFAGDS